jgi:D-alanyl-D-alanine dipeptidase
LDSRWIQIAKSICVLPNLAGLLTANEELARALLSYDQMMRRRRAVQASRATATFRADTGSFARVRDSYIPSREGTDMISFSREGSPTSDDGRGTGDSSQTAQHSSHTTTPAVDVPSVDPFADEPYYVSGPADVASVIRSG